MGTLKIDEKKLVGEMIRQLGIVNFTASVAEFCHQHAAEQRRRRAEITGDKWDKAGATFLDAAMRLKSNEIGFIEK